MSGSAAGTTNDYISLPDADCRAGITDVRIYLVTDETTEEALAWLRAQQWRTWGPVIFDSRDELWIFGDEDDDDEGLPA